MAEVSRPALARRILSGTTIEDAARLTDDGTSANEPEADLDFSLISPVGVSALGENRHARLGLQNWPWVMSAFRSNAAVQAEGAKLSANEPDMRASTPSTSDSVAQLYAEKDEQMILRVFRVVIGKGRVDDFKRLVQEQSIPWLMESDGMLGYFPGEPFAENEREFTMVTLWRDLGSIKSFCGDDWNNPVVTEDEEPLVEAMYVEHYQRFDK